MPNARTAKERERIHTERRRVMQERAKECGVILQPGNPGR
jgi:hypothetical protein